MFVVVKYLRKSGVHDKNNKNDNIYKNVWLGKNHKITKAKHIENNESMFGYWIAQSEIKNIMFFFFVTIAYYWNFVIWAISVLNLWRDFVIKKCDITVVFVVF